MRILPFMLIPIRAIAADIHPEDYGCYPDGVECTEEFQAAVDAAGGKAANWAGQYFPPAHASSDDGWFWMHIPLDWELADETIDSGDVTGVHWTLGIKGTGAVLEVDRIEIYPAGHIAYPNDDYAIPTIDTRTMQLDVGGVKLTPSDLAELLDLRDRLQGY